MTREQAGVLVVTAARRISDQESDRLTAVEVFDGIGVCPR
jgi:hypothetical protein